MESAVGAFAWRCSLLLPSGSEHRTDHVGPRWVSFAAKVQYLSRTAQPGLRALGWAKWKGHLKDPLLLVGGNPDPGVADRHVQPHLRFGLGLGLDPHHHVAALGELNGVPHDVDHDLP